MSLTGKDLNAEERALFHQVAIGAWLGQPGAVNGESIEQSFNAAFRYIEFQRALFSAPVASEGGKVERCPNCFNAVHRKFDHWQTREDLCGYTCTLYAAREEEKVEAPPVAAPMQKVFDRSQVRERMANEPDVTIGAADGVAPPVAATELEMPEAVLDVLEILRATAKSQDFQSWNQYADALESWYRAQAAAAKVGRVYLPAVRIALQTMKTHFEPNCQGQCQWPMVWEFCEKAIAELNAAETR